MSRFLSVKEESVSESERAEYSARLSARRSEAARADLHFWIFAHSEDPQRFVEFVEGADASLVAQVAGVESASLWRSIEEI